MLYLGVFMLHIQTSLSSLKSAPRICLIAIFREK